MTRVGHPLIDLQHASLIACIKRLEGMAAESPDWEVVDDQLTKVTTLTAEHFETEESVMLELKMPVAFFEAHRQEHRRILGEIADFHLNALQGHREHLESVAAMLHDWIIAHLQKYDCQLLPLLSAKRSKPAV